MTEAVSGRPVRDNSFRLVSNPTGEGSAQPHDPQELGNEDILVRNFNDALAELPENLPPYVTMALAKTKHLFYSLFNKFQKLQKEVTSSRRATIEERTKRVKAEAANTELERQLEAAKAEITRSHQQLALAKAAIAESKKTEEEMELRLHEVMEDSKIDKLTGLSNIHVLANRLQIMHANARGGRNSYTALFIDFDGFKFVNDNLGHEIGDETLKIGAKILKSCVRETDVVCRKGGDEFVILVEGLTPQETLDTMQRIFTRCAELQDLNEKLQEDGKNPREILGLIHKSLDQKPIQNNATSNKVENQQEHQSKLSTFVPIPVMSIGMFHCDTDSATKYSPTEILNIADTALAAAKGKIQDIKTSLLLAWDNTLPPAKGKDERGKQAGKHGHAAIAIYSAENNGRLFITGVPNNQNRADTAIAMSDKLLNFINLYPVRESSRRNVQTEIGRHAPKQHLPNHFSR